MIKVLISNSIKVIEKIIRNFGFNFSFSSIQSECNKLIILKTVSQRLTSKPQFCRWPRKSWTSKIYGEETIIESLILSIFEKVCFSICPLKSSINVIWKIPTGYVSGIPVSSHVRYFFRIKLPVFSSFEEVDFVVSSPYKSCIHIVWNARKSYGYEFRIIRNGDHVLEFPVKVSFEEISGFRSLPSKCGINVIR